MVVLNRAFLSGNDSAGVKICSAMEYIQSSEMPFFRNIPLTAIHCRSRETDI
jgi:hypothetical protein